MGAATDVSPMASPIRTRLAIRMSTLGAIAEKIEPAIKLNPAAMLVQRLPIVSEEVPPTSAPNNAPKVTALTTSPCWAGPRWKSGTMNNIAPAITPVSKPNKRPPNAATAAINVMYKVTRDRPAEPSGASLTVERAIDSSVRPASGVLSRLLIALISPKSRTPATHEAHKQIHGRSNTVFRTNLLAESGSALTHRGV